MHFDKVAELTYDILKETLGKGRYGKYCAKLVLGKDISTVIKYIDHLIQVCNIIIAHSNLQSSKICIEHDALTLLKMLPSKLAVVKKIIKEPDLTFDGILGNQYISHKIIDHVTLYAVIRMIFESLCVYELIYVFPHTKDEQELVYNLYQLAGVSDQLQIIPDKEIYQKEKEQLAEEIQTLTRFIHESVLYGGNESKIEHCIDNEQFNIAVEDERVIVLQGYRDTILRVGFKPDYIHGIYKYLCLNAHQTSVAVTQFHEACEVFNPEAKPIVLVAARLAINLASVLVVDFIKQNRELVAVFDQFKDYIQYLVDAPNVLFRGQEYSLVNQIGKRKVE